MALTPGSAAAVVAGALGLGAMLTNPHCEAKDFVQPQSLVQKMDYHSGYNNSGRVYVLGAVVLTAALAGLGYNALTGQVVRRREE